MSTKSATGKTKKFRGFTSLFKNANKKETKPEPEEAKKPFAGFTEAYKHFKPPQYDDYEYEDEDEDFVSFRSPVAPEEVKKVKVEYKHFVPTKYNEWRDERLEVVQEKMQTTAKVEPKEIAEVDRPRPAPAKEPKGEFTADLNEVFRTKLTPFRDLNEYPMRYQLEKINDRMKRYLTTMDECDGHSESISHSNRSEVPPRINAIDTHRRQLKEYFGRNVSYCRTKPIDFRREQFDDWFSKFTFNYERKYKDMPDVSYTLYPEDFGSWYQRVSEKVNNKYRNVPENVTRQNLMATHTYFGDGNRTEQIPFDNSDAPLSGTFPSLSHCETCREI